MCEQLKVRDITDDLLIQVNGSFVAGYKVSGINSYYASDAERNRTVSLPLHDAIYQAIIARDAAAAREAMQKHLDDTERRRVAALRRARTAKNAALR